MNKYIHKVFSSAFAACLTCLSGIGQAGVLSLSDTPLYLTVSVEPNIFFLIDDSGSMEWEVLLQGAGGTGLGAGILTGRYVLPSPNNGADIPWHPNYPYTINDEDSISGQGLWRLKNSSFNALYYNPELTYSPWPGTNSSGAALYSNATPSAALADPTNADAGTLDLTSDITVRMFRWDTFVWYQATFYPAKYYTWTDSNSNGVVDASDAHARVEIRSSIASYTGGANRKDCVAAPTCTYAEEIQNFANWYTYYRKRNYVGRGAIGAVINDANAVRSGIHLYNDGLRQSVLSLSSASNKRTLLSSLYSVEFPCTSTDCPGTPARSAMAAVGEYFKGASSPILSAANGGNCQQNFNVVVTDGYWNGGFDTIKNADGDNNTTFDGGHYADAFESTLADVAMHYYETDLKPGLADDVPTIAGVDEAEHQHLVTYSVAFGVVGSLDPFGTKTPSVASDTDPSHDDFAWPAITANNETTVDDLWHAAYNGRGNFVSAQDPAELTEALGEVISSIEDRTSSSASVALSTGSLSSSSLLFQARFDSTAWMGQLLAYSIVASGNNIGDVGTLQWDAACVLTGGSCPIDGKSYTGQHWETGREIITYKPSNGAGIPFLWPSDPSSPSATELDVAQTNHLKEGLAADDPNRDSTGADRLKFLRGATIAGMRTRDSLLGDIISSNPLLVGAPPFSYPDSLESVPYSTFAASKQSRDPIIYVGANDGMLHGFLANTTTEGGEEKIAYVPGEVFENLYKLTSPDYGSSTAHTVFVDASPAAGDVFWGGSWKTVLVGGLGKGGQGIYALNVTDPSNFSESNASSLVLWEFTDADDVDLGYTYGQPAVVRMNNNKWAVIVGNGYNNTDSRGGSDTRVSTSGNAVLYILDVENGSVIKKIDTTEGTADDPISGAARPNGLASPSPVDLDGDNIVDLIYVGDLFGNVWKIDVSSSNASQWSIVGGGPIYSATNAGGSAQPITTKIEVGLHPTLPGQMVYFGTGKYLENGDHAAAGQQTQSFYGIWDRNESTLSTITRTHLHQHQILEEKGFPNTTNQVRITTDTGFTWHTAGGLPSSGGGKLGWYMDLYSTENSNTNNYGERMVADPVLRDGKIIFVTLLPKVNPCEFGGDSWLMEVDASTGARLLLSPFDLNGDKVFSTLDLVANAAGTGVVVSGVKSGVGILPSPGILTDNSYGGAGDAGTVAGDTAGVGREFKYFSGSTGGIQKVSESRGSASFGRQSWREIFND